MRKLPNDRLGGSHTPERKCILSGDHAARDALVRLALSPDGEIFPDVRAKAPGRGAWIGVDRQTLEVALAKGKLKGALARAFKTNAITIGDDLGARIEDALRNAASAGFQVINLRLGIFAGRRYALGVLPILVPRLKTHLVPWVAGGRTSMPIIDGRDIGQVFVRAAIAEGLAAYEGFNVVGPDVPSVREVITFLHDEYGLPKPHFGVPFALAYPFAWLMEMLDPIVPWEPLVTRSIIHLMEEVGADNSKAERLLGYHPSHSWREAIREQMREMSVRQPRPMSMARPTA